MYNLKIFIFFSLVLLLLSCESKITKEFVVYSVSNDSTLFYYQKGWKQIMDEGSYSAAEISFRKTLSFSPDFLVGQSVLARLTLDLAERLALYQNLENQKEKLTGDERKILDVYMALTHYTNLRDQKSPDTENALRKALLLAETNFREIVHKYPQEIYLKAEYIEMLHANRGAKQALDSLKLLLIDSQKNNPFLVGYEAVLEAELKNYDVALKKATQLKSLFGGIKIAKPDAIFADIYFGKGDLENAKIHADRAYYLDAKNLDASRLKTKIDEALTKRDSLDKLGG